MLNLTVPNAATHGQLKVSSRRPIVYAQGRHMMPLHVGEVSRAIMDFPVLISRVTGQSEFALSAITSFTPSQNAFLDGEAWQATFVPAEMQSFPFALIRGDDGQPVLAMDETVPVFSQDDGEPLFDAQGQPALWTSQLKTQLIADAEHMAQTRHFLTELSELGLISQIFITLHQANGEANKIGGLHTIHEDRLKSLDADKLADLNARGLLGPIYAILFSIFQLNTLIHRHNRKAGSEQIQRISLEIAKDMHQA